MSQLRSLRRLSAMAATTSTSTSASSPSVTVTADELAHALDKMGLTESVSAALLYDTILQLQSPPQPQTTPGPSDAIPQTAKEGSPVEHRRYPGPISPATASVRRATQGPGDAIPQTAKEGSSNQPSRFGDTTRPVPDSDFFDPVRVEERRILREMMKASFPNGPP